jgi:hypothetical protein
MGARNEKKKRERERMKENSKVASGVLNGYNTA